MALTVSTCDACGGAIAAPVELCYACDTAGDRVATAAARPGDGPDTPDVLTMRDFAMLERFARLRLQPDDPAAQALLEKLDKARILHVETIAADIATLGSRVVFSVDDGRPEARVLVLPAQHAAAGWTLPVTAPRGMALLGRAAGAVVSAARHDGATERLHVLDVIHQPEAAAATAAAVMRGEGDRPGRTALPHPAPWPVLHRTWPVAPRRPRDGSAPEPG